MNRPRRPVGLLILAGAAILVGVRGQPGFREDSKIDGASASSSIEVQIIVTRSMSDVVHDKYFIPGLASIGAFVILVALCFYMLGWCFNSQRREKLPDTQWAPQTILADNMYPNSSQPRALSTEGNGPGELGSPGSTRRQSNVQRKPPPQAHSNSIGSRTPPPNLPLGMSQGFHMPQETMYAPQTVQFESQPQLAPGTVHMTVTPSNPPVARMNRGFWSRDKDQTRMSTFSSGQSSTQVGSEKDSQNTDRYPPAGGGQASSQSEQSSPEFGKRPHDLTRSPTYQEHGYFDPYGGINQGYGFQQKWDGGHARSHVSDGAGEGYRNEPSFVSPPRPEHARNPTYSNGPPYTMEQ